MFMRRFACLGALALTVGAPVLGTGCSNANDDENTGMAQIAISQVPLDGTVGCIAVTATGSHTVTQSVDVWPGQSTVLDMHHLPVGTVSFLGNAYLGACAAVTPASLPTWISDPVLASVNNVSPVPVHLSLHRNGKADVDVGFDDEPSCRADGAPCFAAAECCSQSCVAGACQPAAQASCADGIKNGAETDVDCGGTCPACAEGKACVIGVDCVSGSCANGVCAQAQGECQTPSDCPGVDTECQSRVCTAGTCGMLFAAAGTTVSAQTPGDCKRIVCDGMGSLMMFNDDSDLPADDGNQCTIDVCTSGIPIHVPAAAGTVCNQNGGSACDGAGTCISSCTDGVKNGAETDVDCGGSACQACAGGKACASNADCATGFCDPASHVCSTMSGLLAAGSAHTCAVVDGGAQCWGKNANGQLGTGGTTESDVPVHVAGLSSGVQAISAGFYHTCAVVGGGAQCWGYNSGLLGNGDTADSAVPVGVMGLTSGVSAIAAGYDHTCAVVSGGARCWGDNGMGQLGTGDTAHSPVPMGVVGLGSGVSAIVTGAHHTCALVNGGVRCWGYNDVGQLGNGSTTESHVPVQVQGLTSGVQAIAGGFYHACALVNGGVQCWGTNGSGQLGNGSTIGSLVPVQVQGLTSGVQAIASFGDHTCALVDGGVQCWGYNGMGQLGNGSTIGSLVPVQVQGLTSGVTTIAGGIYHTCAWVNGGVQCWGYNANGQLGNDSTIDSPVPVAVSAWAP